jgi:predicted Zn-dependent protease with MMP-like domain
MPIKISARKFETLVVQALEELPAFFKDRLQNIEVLIADWPTEEELEEAGIGPEELLLGLYQGVPLTERTSDYGMVLPDTITLYRECIAEVCDTPEEIVAEASHPRQALELYLAQVKHLIDSRGRENYATAARYLRRIQALYQGLNEVKTWEKLIADIYQNHRQLRALKEELAKVGL